MQFIYFIYLYPYNNNIFNRIFFLDIESKLKPLNN